jgi:hypothetical protein
VVRTRHPIRYYDLDGKKLPSVTSILGRTSSIFEPSKESGLDFWRSREPNHRKILSDACRRGTIVHSEIELALSGKQSTEFTLDEWTGYNIPGYMTHLYPLIGKIDKSDCELEKTVYHPAGYAGTADLVCYYNGKRTLVDWKTTRPSAEAGEKPRTRSRYKGAELQVSAYAAAYNSDPRNPPVTDAMVVVLYDWKEPDIFELDSAQLVDRFGSFVERLTCYQALEAVSSSPTGV